MHFLPLENLLSHENKRKTLSPRQPLSGQRVLRIPGSQQNDIRKGLLRLATVTVGALMSGRSREVADKFKRRRVDVGYRQEVRYRGQGILTRVYEGEGKYKFLWSGSEENKNSVGIME